MVKRLCFVFRYALCVLLSATLLVPVYADQNSTEKLEGLLQRATALAMSLELRLQRSEKETSEIRKSLEILKKDSETTIAELKQDLTISGENYEKALMKVANLQDSLAKLETKLSELETIHKQELLGWQIATGIEGILLLGLTIYIMVKK